MKDRVAPRPPLYTLLVELVGWTLDRTADLPKSHRFTFGQRLDGLALDAAQHVVQAIYCGDARRKEELLSELILTLEQSQLLWRLAQERRWISLQQLTFISARLNEAGRMANGWRQQQNQKATSTSRDHAHERSFPNSPIPSTPP